ERNEVRLLQQHGKARQLPDTRNVDRLDERVEHDDLHPERERALRHPPPDVAVADEAQRMSTQLMAEKLRALVRGLAELVTLEEEALRAWEAAGEHHHE